jgi:hypothetical protein
LLAAASANGPESLSASIVVADAPGYQRRFLPIGVRVVPLWSPQVDWLFDPTLPAPEAAKQWRDSGVRYIILTKWRANLDFFNARARWAKPPFQTRLVGETEFTAIFAIRADG